MIKPKPVAEEEKTIQTTQTMRAYDQRLLAKTLYSIGSLDNTDTGFYIAAGYSIRL
jgi:hypothetical protein